MSKTPGQVGYEAMVENFTQRDGEEWTFTWDQECERLHQDWEHVGAAVAAAERAAVVKYLHIVADCNADVTRRAFAKHLANDIEKGEHHK